LQRNQKATKQQQRQRKESSAQQQQQHGADAVNKKWNGDEALEGDYDGFEDLNEVELIDTNRPAILGALRQEAALPLSGCCSCAPLQSIASSDLKPTTIETAARQLAANALFDKLPEAKKMLRDLLAQLPEQFTVFLPSNEAVDRLPRALISRLKRRPNELRLVLANHLVSGQQTLAQLMRDKVLKSRAARSSMNKSRNSILRVNVSRNETATVNGQRLLLVDQPIKDQSHEGLLHLVDGLLYPLADQNLLDTLKACNKFDGFVTLAQGTGLSDILEQGNCLLFLILIKFSCLKIKAVTDNLQLFLFDNKRHFLHIVCAQQRCLAKDSGRRFRFDSEQYDGFERFDCFYVTINYNKKMFFFLLKFLISILLIY
jgi:uncharacterized surface protein with fasciclin (FAS1) repeats